MIKTLSKAGPFTRAGAFSVNWLANKIILSKLSVPGIETGFHIEDKSVLVRSSCNYNILL
jgi:hypothetical protein